MTTNLTRLMSRDDDVGEIINKDQKRPDVYKIVLSTIAFPPPPPEKVSFRGFSTDLYSFSSFWALFGGGG